MLTVTVHYPDTLTVTGHYTNTATHLITITVHYPNTAICLQSLSTIPAQRHTYHHRPLSQHSYILTVTVHYPNTATHLPSPTQRHTVTVHYPNTATRLPSLFTIPTQRHTHCTRRPHKQILFCTCPVHFCSFCLVLFLET